MLTLRNPPHLNPGIRSTHILTYKVTITYPLWGESWHPPPYLGTHPGASPLCQVLGNRKHARASFVENGYGAWGFCCLCLLVGTAFSFHSSRWAPGNVLEELTLSEQSSRILETVIPAQTATSSMASFQLARFLPLAAVSQLALECPRVQESHFTVCSPS